MFEILHKKGEEKTTESKEFVASVIEAKKQFGNEQFLKSAIDFSMVEKMVEKNEVLRDMFQEIKEYFFEYSRILIEYDMLLNRIMSNPDDESLLEERRELDQRRGISHDAMIASVNIFSRALKKTGIETKIFDGLESRIQYAHMALASTFKELLKLEEVECEKKRN
jgi:hypothetical protein